jgi:hypothetical protein
MKFESLTQIRSKDEMHALPNDEIQRPPLFWSQNHLGLGFARSLAMLTKIRYKYDERNYNNFVCPQIDGLLELTCLSTILTILNIIFFSKEYFYL